ncbi:MAG: hypothetical protein Q8L47_03190 [bacterium]|nr:hypothetical protein [bacterium]
MHQRFFVIIFLLLIFLGLSGFIAIRLGFFPIAIVNTHFIRESYFNEAAEVIVSGYKADSKLGNTELRRLTLQKIIEDQLIKSEAEKYFGSSLSDGEKPESVRAMLKDQVSLLGTSFDDWLRGARQKANVLILVSGYSWSGDQVIVCKDGQGDKSITGIISEPRSIFTGC